MITKRLRYEILRRDDHACRYCGARAPDAKLTVDHVVPTALGGTDESSNLVTACADCNAGKSSTTPDAPIVDGVAQDAIRWAQAMKAAAWSQSQARDRRRAYIDHFDEAWLGWHLGDDETRKIPRPNDWANTIAHWFDLNIEVELLIELMQEAMPNHKLLPENIWRYFCGMTWRVVRERQELASFLVDLEGDDPDA